MHFTDKFFVLFCFLALETVLYILPVLGLFEVLNHCVREQSNLKPLIIVVVVYKKLHHKRHIL